MAAERIKFRRRINAEDKANLSMRSARRQYVISAHVTTATIRRSICLEICAKRDSALPEKLAFSGKPQYFLFCGRDKL